MKDFIVIAGIIIVVAISIYNRVNSNDSEYLEEIKKIEDNIGEYGKEIDSLRGLIAGIDIDNNYYRSYYYEMAKGIDSIADNIIIDSVRGKLYQLGGPRFDSEVIDSGRIKANVSIFD